jgi:hypothetical protein
LVITTQRIEARAGNAVPYLFSSTGREAINSFILTSVAGIGKEQNLVTFNKLEAQDTTLAPLTANAIDWI